MNHDDFTDKLGRLMSAMHDAPAGASAEHVRAVRSLESEAAERQEKLRTTVRTLQESLDQLRLSVKYLVFDLEATRRENEYLRKLLAAGDAER